MTSFPDNSQAAAPKEKRVKAAVVSGAVPVKRPATKRFMDFLFAESPSAIGQKVATEVVMPRVKQGLFEAGQSFLAGMLFKGDSNLANSMLRSGTMRGGGNMYSSHPGASSSLLTAKMANEPPKRVSYEDVAFPTQQQAEILLANMIEILNEYRAVAIGDFNDLMGHTSQPSDNAYGWTNLDGARISVDRNGFRLELPRPTLIT